MKLRHLRFFVAVVDCGGVVRAAERLHVSQPAVSAGLKALEQSLGQPLFERTGGGQRLRRTAKTIEFHRSAMEILRLCDAARAQIRTPEPRPPRLRIGVLQTIASEQVAAVSAALARHHPDHLLQVCEGGPLQLAEGLRRQAIDAAWTNVERDGTHARLLWREPFVVLSSRAYRLGKRRRASVSLADLDGESIVLRACCEMKRGQLWPGNVRMRVVARAERDELALRLVAQGLGIAIAPRSLATGDVVARPIQDLDVTRSIGLKWRSDLPQTVVATMLETISSVGRPRRQ